MTRLEELKKTGKNIFSLDDLAVLWKVDNRRDATESVKDYVRRGRMFSIRRGIYSIEKEYSEFELAQKLITPSYVSYYSALAYHGIIFQNYEDIFCFALYNKTIQVDGRKYSFHKVKNDILLNSLGIVRENNFMIASKERAVCDSLYINIRCAFDNLDSLDSKKLLEISQIYSTKTLIKEIEKIIVQIDNNA